MKYAFVEKHRRQYGVPALCEALQVSRSGYYAARHRGPSDRQKRQVDLTARIRTIHQASRESYGAPRVHVELMAQEVPCCRNTVATLMHRAGDPAQGDPAVPRDHRLPPDQGIAEPHPPGLHVRTSQRPLAERHHLHPDAGRLALPGGGSGRVLESRGGLGDEPNAGHQAGDGRVDYGDRASRSTGNAALRPGVNVRHRKLPGHRQSVRDQAEHEPQG